MLGKMEFKEIVKLEKIFNKYLNYNGINLWQLSETPIYENFLKSGKKRNFISKKKELLLRQIVKIKNRKKEGEKTEEIGNKKEIVIVIYGLSPINTFKPIIEKLKDKIKIIRYDPPSENTTKESFEKNKISYTNIDNYIDDEIRKKIKEAERWLREQWKKIKADNELKKFLGENYSSIMGALEYFCNTRKSYLEVIRLIELYNRLYEIEKPKEVIVSDDANAYGRAAVLVAKKKKIKTLCIQHGQLQGNVVVNEGAENIIVNGLQDKEYLISRGIKSEKIIVCGQIRFDNILQKMKLSKREICNKYSLDADKKIITYSYQKPIPGENIINSAKDCFLENVKEFNKNKKYQIVVTMRTDVPIPKEFNNKDFTLLPGADIQELAVCSEILITAFSTAAIEFVLMGKPVIAINIDSKPEEYIDYTKMKVGFKITKKEDFLDALKTCLNDQKFHENFKKAREKFIENYNYKLDGKALERIINEINKLLK